MGLITNLLNGIGIEISDYNTKAPSLYVSEVIQGNNYEELTESQVYSWIDVSDDYEYLKQAGEKALFEQRYPPKIIRIPPWNSSTSTTATSTSTVVESTSTSTGGIV